MTQEELRQVIVDEARTWLRTPFRNNAMIKGAGVGCGTLLIAVYSKFGFSTPEPDKLGYFPLGWSMHTREEKYLDILLAHGMKEVETPQKGDAVLFQMGRAYGHSGIIVEWPFVIHSYWGRGVMIDDARNPPLGQKTKFLSFL